MNAKPIIFYAEDDLDDQEVFKSVLSESQCSAELYCQNHGEQLLDDLKHHSVLPNFIFLDLNMPERSGFQVLQEIREKDEYNRIPIIILSTTNDPVACYRAKNLGANLFLTKPTNYNQFISLMHMTLSMDWYDLSETKQPFYTNIS